MSKSLQSAKHSETKVSGAQKFIRISWILRNLVIMEGAFT